MGAMQTSRSRVDLPLIRLAKSNGSCIVHIYRSRAYLTLVSDAFVQGEKGRTPELAVARIGTPGETTFPFCRLSAFVPSWRLKSLIYDCSVDAVIAGQTVLWRDMS